MVNINEISLKNLEPVGILIPAKSAQIYERKFSLLRNWFKKYTAQANINEGDNT